MKKHSLYDVVFQLRPLPKKLTEKQYVDELIAAIDERLTVTEHRHRYLLLNAGHVSDYLYFVERGIVRGFYFDKKAGRELTAIIWKEQSAKQTALGNSWMYCIENNLQTSGFRKTKHGINDMEKCTSWKNQETDVSFAELQARNRNPMYMKDWNRKLNDFMTLKDKEILEYAKTSLAKIPKELAESEYKKYCKNRVEIEYVQEIRELEEGLKIGKHKERKVTRARPTLYGLAFRVFPDKKLGYPVCMPAYIYTRVEVNLHKYARKFS